MDLVANLAQGLATALAPVSLAYCLAGVIVGTAIGVLPGLGPTATISLLLPITYHLDPVASIIMLSGIYYGAMYGSSITAILVRIPGEAASIVTCIDGHEMARRGRAGPALGMSAIASFIAGMLATCGIMVFGPMLASVALQFGPAEYSALVALGLVLVTHVSGGSVLRSLLMVGLGLLFSTVGLDPITASERYTFGQYMLQDGFDIAIMAMGLFGVSEVIGLAERKIVKSDLLAQPRRTRDLLPNAADWRASAAPITRGSLLGFFLGLLPGGGALIASFASYVVEKRVARSPERFGTGAIEGVAGPEAANNAAAQASFVPLLSLGIPSNVVMGVIVGALMIHGVTPGPTLMANQPQLFWGVIISMFVGNIMLVILNLPMLPIFVSLLKIPYRILSPLILVFCVVGAYSLKNNTFDILLLSAFGVAGYLARKVKLDPAPFLLAFVLGGLFERSIRQALLIGNGSPWIFLQKPISAALLALVLLLLLLPLVRFAISAMRRPQRTVGSDP